MAESKGYIVNVDDNTSDSAFANIKEQVKKLGGSITHEYELIKGFAVKMPSTHLPSIKSLPGVSSIEEDQEVKIQK